MDISSYKINSLVTPVLSAYVYNASTFYSSTLAVRYFESVVVLASPIVRKRVIRLTRIAETKTENTLTWKNCSRSPKPIGHTSIVKCVSSVVHTKAVTQEVKVPNQKQ